MVRESKRVFRTFADMAEAIQPDGVRLLRLLESRELKSIRPRAEKLATLPKISSVIITGTSLVGKSTLVDAVRGAMETNGRLASLYQIPRRVITRPQRANDNLTENKFVTADEFNEMVQRGELGVHWERKMDGERKMSVGFVRVEGNKIPIYSANNSVIDNVKRVKPSDLLEQPLIIAVYSPEDVRRERMRHRSPDLLVERPEEAQHRLSDRAVSMYPDAHLVVKNFGRFQKTSKDDVVALFGLMSKLKS